MIIRRNGHQTQTRTVTNEIRITTVPYIREMAANEYIYAWEVTVIQFNPNAADFDEAFETRQVECVTYFDEQVKNIAVNRITDYFLGGK